MSKINKINYNNDSECIFQPTSHAIHRSTPIYGIATESEFSHCQIHPTVISELGDTPGTATKAASGYEIWNTFKIRKTILSQSSYIFSFPSDGRDTVINIKINNQNVDFYNIYYSQNELQIAVFQDEGKQSPKIFPASAECILYYIE